MKQNTLISLLCLIVFAAGAFHILEVSKNAPQSDGVQLPQQTGAAPNVMPEKNTGPTTHLYRYECDEHVSFDVSYAPNMSALHIAPAQASSTFPPKGVLLQQTSASGVRYTNKDLVFTGKGESVTLGEGEQALHCSPSPKQDEAPMNFGD